MNEKKVFAFVGSRSPKRVTYGLVQNIIKEISRQRNITSKIISLNDVNIKPCLGCKACFKIGKCRQEDDLALLCEEILSSDLFILGAPVYMHGMPGEMKNIIDRLATWAHTLRLAKKSILIVSTCDSNGHTTVVDDLHLKMLHMGGRIIGKCVGTNYIPEGFKSTSEVFLLKNALEIIPSFVNDVIKIWDQKVMTNRFNESLFANYKAYQKELINMNKETGETNYWIKSGMIQCENFQEFIDKI